MLLTLESGPNALEKITNFSLEVVTRFVNVAGSVFFCPLCDVLEGAFGSDDGLSEVLLTNIFDRLACLHCKQITKHIEYENLTFNGPYI